MAFCKLNQTVHESLLCLPLNKCKKNIVEYSLILSVLDDVVCCISPFFLKCFFVWCFVFSQFGSYILFSLLSCFSWDILLSHCASIRHSKGSRWAATSGRSDGYNCVWSQIPMVGCAQSRVFTCQEWRILLLTDTAGLQHELLTTYPFAHLGRKGVSEKGLKWD